MKTPLYNVTINSKESAKLFLSILHENGESYHPEDDAFDIDFGKRVSNSDRQQLNALMAQVNKFIDPCEFLLKQRHANGAQSIRGVSSQR